MANYITVVGAYGRDYKSAKEAKKDWRGGRDFRIVTVGAFDGAYINRQDAKAANLTVMIRYKNLTMIVPAE
jgi:hypothetical protein